MSSILLIGFSDQRFHRWRAHSLNWALIFPNCLANPSGAGCSKKFRRSSDHLYHCYCSTVGSLFAINGAGSARQVQLDRPPCSSQKWNRERGELEISRASFGRIQELDAIQRSHLGCHNFSQHFNWGFGHTKSWATGLFFFSKSFGAIAEVSVSAPVTHHLRSNHLSTQLAFWPFGSDGSPAMMFARQKPPDSKLETLQLFDLISTFNLLQVFRSSASMLRLKSWAKIFCALRYFRLCVLMFAVDLRRFGNSNLAITKVLHKRIVFQIILYIACVIFHVYYAHDMQFPCMNKSNVNHYQSHLL